jgi:hypothetical protein
VQEHDMDRFNLRSLNDVEVKKQYEVKISNRYVTLKNLMMMMMMMMMWTSMGLGKVLEKILKLHSQTV